MYEIIEIHWYFLFSFLCLEKTSGVAENKEEFSKPESNNINKTGYITVKIFQKPRKRRCRETMEFKNQFI